MATTEQHLNTSFHTATEFFENDEICRVTSKGDIQFGTVLRSNESEKSFEVDWKSKTRQESFIEEIKPHSDSAPITLIDRRHCEGSRVQDANGRVGKIVDGFKLAWILLPDSKHIIKDIDFEKLSNLSLFTGEHIEFDGFIGKVSSVDWLVTVEYSDGERCNFTITQTYQSNSSFGYEIYGKLSPPCANRVIVPNDKEYETAVWHGISLFDKLKQYMDAHFMKSATIIGSKMSKVYVKWLCKYDGSNPQNLESMPRCLDNEGQIGAIQQFDFNFREWLKIHSFCNYPIQEGDEFIDENKIEDFFITELEKSQEEDSEMTKKVKFDFKSSTAHEVGKTVLAEVIRLRHVYRVQWVLPSSMGTDALPLEEMLGALLSPWSGLPLSPYGFDIKKPFKREYVQSKFSFEGFENNSEIVFGVRQHWFSRDELVEVLWYVAKPGGVAFLEQRVSSPYELLPHMNFQTLKPGAVVTAKTIGCQNVHETSEFTVGMIIRINQAGLVEIYCTDETTKVMSPFELQVINFPKEKFTPVINQNSSIDINDRTLDFAECLANDLEELLDICPESIKVKHSSPESLDSFSVLITGPEHTPYENGLFIFDVQLPRDYPNVAPKIKFRSLPQGNAHLSPNLTSDGEVRLPILENWPGTPEEAWNRGTSFLDFLITIRDEIFVREPYLNRAEIKFHESKDKLAANDKKILAVMTQLNASVLITTVDLLLNLYNQPPENWNTEIIDHVKAVTPKLIYKFQSWVDSPVGIFGDLKEYPKHHIFPISYGLKLSLIRRIDLLNKLIN